MTELLSPFATHLLSLAQAASSAVDPAQPAQPFWVPMVPMVLVVAVMYFVVLRPQMKAKKDQDLLISSAKTGERIITTGGIYGVITNVKDTTLIVKIADNVKIEILKTAVSSVIREKDSSAATPVTTVVTTPEPAVNGKSKKA